MYTVLIAEDDILTRVGIASMLKANHDDLIVVGEAANGKEALSMARHLHPDFLLTDIQMPILNGLDLILAVRKENLCNNIIILSAYNDFEYVRDGMKFGADDYVLKLDVERETLIQKMFEIAKNKINNKKFENSTIDLSKRDFEKERLILKIIKNDFSSKEEMELKLTNAHSHIFGENLICILVNCQKKQHEARKNIDSELNMLKMMIDFTSTFGESYGCKISEYLYCLLISVDNTDQFYDTTISECIRSDLIEYTKSSFNMSINVIISDVLTSFHSVSLFLKSHCSYDGLNYYIIEKQQTEDTLSFYSDELSTLENAIYSDKTGAITSAFQDLHCVLADDLKANAKTMHSVCCIILSFIEQYFKIDLHGETNWRRSSSMLHMNQNCFCKNDYLNFILQLKNMLVEHIQNNFNQHDAVRLAERFIRNNFSQDLSLDKIAHEVNLAPSYFSRLFSQVVGTSITNYLREIRIKKAKELLQNTNEKIQAIGEQVGYPNRYYFCRVFKQTIGMSPTAYRSSVRQ